MQQLIIIVFRKLFYFALNVHHFDCRFRPPAPLSPSDYGYDEGTGTLDATLPTPMCPQFSFDNTEGLGREPTKGLEDCLYLNVNVPEKVQFAIFL